MWKMTWLVFLWSLSSLAAVDAIKVYEFHPLKPENKEISQDQIVPNRIYFAQSHATRKHAILLSRATDKPLAGVSWYLDFLMKGTKFIVTPLAEAPRSASAVLEWFPLTTGTVVAGSFFGLEGDEANAKFGFEQKLETDPQTKQPRLVGGWRKLDDENAPIIIRTCDRFDYEGNEGGLIAWEWVPEKEDWQVLPARTINGKRMIRSLSQFVPGIYEIYGSNVGKNGEPVWAFLFNVKNLTDGNFWPTAVGTVVPNGYLDSDTKDRAKLMKLSLVPEKGVQYARWTAGGSYPYRMIHSKKDEALAYSSSGKWETVAFARERPSAEPDYILPVMGPGQTYYFPRHSSGNAEIDRLNRRLDYLENALRSFPGMLQPLPLGYEPY